MKSFIIGGILLIVSFSSVATPRDDLLNFQSHYSVEQTENRLVGLLTKKGFTIFKQVNHAKGAKSVGLDIPATTVVIFGNPKIGSKLMQCAPTIAIDLPQKALIRTDTQNKVWLSFNNPEYLKNRHKVQGCDKLCSKIQSALNGIGNKVTSGNHINK